jgi:hypothetical protein
MVNHIIRLRKKGKASVSRYRNFNNESHAPTNKVSPEGPNFNDGRHERGSVRKIWACLVILIILILLTLGLPNARPEEKVVDTKFIAVSSYLILTTVFDIETTFAVIRNGGHEENPLMKPFAKNRAYMYGVQLGIDALAIWLSYEMKGSKHKEFRKIWWVAPMIVGTTHGVMGGLNCRYIW